MFTSKTSERRGKKKSATVTLACLFASSGISVTADLLGISLTAVSRDHAAWWPSTCTCTTQTSRAVLLQEHAGVRGVPDLMDGSLYV